MMSREQDILAVSASIHRELSNLTDDAKLRTMRVIAQAYGLTMFQAWVFVNMTSEQPQTSPQPQGENP